MKFKATSLLIKSSLGRSGISQKKFSEATGVHIQVISNIKRGLSGIPAKRARRFAKALNVSVKLVAKTMAEDFYDEYLRRTK